MAIKAFKSGFLTILVLFGGLIWFLSNQGAIGLTFFPDIAEKNAEKNAEKSAKWIVELSDGSKWGYQ